MRSEQMVEIQGLLQDVSDRCHQNRHFGMLFDAVSKGLVDSPGFEFAGIFLP